MGTPIKEQSLLATAVAQFVDHLHQRYRGIKVHPIPPYEDEDFAVEVIVPKGQDLKEVDDECQKECIKLEDRYDVYMLVTVKQAE